MLQQYSNFLCYRKIFKQVKEKLGRLSYGIIKCGLLILMIRLADDIVLIAKQNSTFRKSWFDANGHK